MCICVYVYLGIWVFEYMCIWVYVYIFDLGRCGRGICVSGEEKKQSGCVCAIPVGKFLAG